MNKYYDTLFGDLEGTEMYFKFLKSHLSGNQILELACGTGDLLNKLYEDYEVFGVDIDANALKELKTKYPRLENKVEQGDFLSFRSKIRFDNVICVGDSLNYILNEEDLNRFVDTTVKLSNTIIVDFHHPHRLVEFEEDYFEEGRTPKFDYNYIIEKHDDFLVHTINFLDGNYKQIQQWVFPPNLLINKFKEQGYDVDIYTDFDHKGILKQGEKIFCVFKKEYL